MAKNNPDHYIVLLVVSTEEQWSFSCNFNKAVAGPEYLGGLSLTTPIFSDVGGPNRRGREKFWNFYSQG